MRIVRKVVNPESIRPYTLAYVDMEGIEIPGSKEEDFLYQVTTYSNLSYIKGERWWDTMFRPINELFTTFTKGEQLKLGQMYVECKSCIDHIDTINDLSNVTNKIGRITAKALGELNILPKMMHFVQSSNIPIPELKDIGNQPHHTDEMTFKYDDYIQLTCIVLLCKLYCPIFGELIHTTKKDLDNGLKEIHCIATMRYVFAENFSYISEKLQNYLSSRCDHWVNKKNSANSLDKEALTNAYNGYTSEKFGLFVYASMLIKKFVNVNLYGQSGDIVVYIFSCAKNTIDNLVISMNNKNRVLARIDPGDDVDGNDSILETASVVSTTTVDVPVIIKVGVDVVVHQLLKKYELDPVVYAKTIEYYRQNMSSVTEINKYVLCTFVGNDIGGASGIDLLTIEPYMKLIALTQLYLIKLGYFNVAHMMSIIPTDRLKGSFSSIDIQIEMNKGASYAYKNCKKMFPYEIGKTAWDNSASEICNSIITVIYNYNTPTILWEIMGQECKNNAEFQYDEFILRDMIEFINHVLIKQEEECLYSEK